MAKNILEQLKEIDVEDLQYIERDLCFYQLVSLGFLLFGEKKTSAEFILQKLIILSKNPPAGRGEAVPSGEIMLREYTHINPLNWKESLLEALAIINARAVLRRMGFHWQNICEHFLPHINEFSIHIHPMLKALYKLCEGLEPTEAGKMVLTLNETHLKNPSDHLRFYDYSYLEIFLLDWITRQIIIVGDQHCHGTNIDVLVEYLKLNDKDHLKRLLTESIKHNVMAQLHDKLQCDAKVIAADSTNDMNSSYLSQQVASNCNVIDITKDDERYRVRRETAGFVLIINQNNFYEEANPKLKHLLPKIKFKKTRQGTDMDRDRLSQLFQACGYKAIVKDNLTHLEMLHHISEAVKKSILKDSLIVCILTHGAKDVVYGCNSIPIKISDIQEILAHDNLHNKPKMLIIQACQKDATPFDKYSNDNCISLTYADMLIALSSVPGTEAMRDTLKGSWYIESLCDIIEQKGDRKHMVDILTSVANVVTNKNHKEFMLPIFKSTLRKEFHLPSTS